jgi:hypothetical protein
MTADEVREVLETELGGPFTETTWKRFYKDEVEYFLEHQSPEEWQSLKDLAEDLFEYEKELRRELASGADTEPGIRKRRLGQRKSEKKQGPLKSIGSPALALRQGFVPKSLGNTWRRSPLLITSWLATAGKYSANIPLRLPPFRHIGSSGRRPLRP